jgi:hypothetical protein
VFHEHEVTARQVRDIRRVAGQKIIDPDDRVAPIEELFGQMRADEAGGAGDDYSHKKCSMLSAEC